MIIAGRRHWSGRGRVLLVALIGFWLVSLPAGASAAGRAAAAQGTPGSDSGPEPCAEGRLTIGNLDQIDAQVQDALKVAGERARTWHQDARLVAFRVGCELLEPRFRFRATYFSDAVQTYFYSDTGETAVADPDEKPGETLNMDGVQFSRLGLSLIRAGYNESVTFDPGSNVEVRLNSNDAPFGPQEVPKGIALFHVALESRGEIVDLFVSATDYTVYQYPR
jgi:hypothetical protein